MKPPKRDIEYERVRTDDFVTGTIAEIEYDQKHEFKFQGNVNCSPAVRFVFQVDGYQYKHRSRWMTFSYTEKSNLYQKYLTSLVEGAMPDMDYDLDNLKGMKVKILWAERNGFQWPETIRPVTIRVYERPKNPNQLTGLEISEDELAPDQDTPF